MPQTSLDNCIGRVLNGFAQYLLLTFKLLSLMMALIHLSESAEMPHQLH